MSVRRNTVYNLIGSIVPLAVSLITIPLYLNLIGESRYGVLAIAWLLLGYFGLFDLGLGRATAQRIAALKNQHKSQYAEVFWTALTVNVLLGIIGGILIWPVSIFFFDNYFIIEDVLRPELESAIPWLILAVPVATLSGVLTGALQGREAFLELNLVSMFGAILLQVLPLVLASMGFLDLGILLPVTFLTRLLVLALLFWRCQKHIFGGYTFVFSRSAAKHLVHFGGWVTVTSIIGPMMVILDRFVIGALIGAKAVSYYTIPFQLSERTTVIAGSLSSALFPRFAFGSEEQKLQLAKNSLQILIIILTPLICLGILIIDPFIRWWITPEFAEKSVLVGQILLIGFWLNSLANIPYAQLQAKGRPDLVAKSHLLELIPYFILLYVGLNHFGIVGAAIVFSLRVFSDLLLLTGFAGTLKDTLPNLVLPLAIVGFAVIIANSPIYTSGKWYWIAAGYFMMTGFLMYLKMPSQIRSFFKT